MAEVSRTFTVAAPLEKVVAYLRDFANTTAWDPGTDKCEQTTPGPVAVGTEWHNVSSFFGRTTELAYRMTRDDPDHVVFEGRNKTAATSDDLRSRRWATSPRRSPTARISASPASRGSPTPSPASHSRCSRPRPSSR